MAKVFKTIPASLIHEGVRYSSPLFFDDGENMFLAEKKEAKPYHIYAIKRWGLEKFLTYGHELTDSEILSMNEKNAIASRSLKTKIQDLSQADEVEELEELEEI
jgi:hypothetical protein